MGWSKQRAQEIHRQALDRQVVYSNMRDRRFRGAKKADSRETVKDIMPPFCPLKFRKRSEWVSF